jgi:hypothetical protein
MFTSKKRIALLKKTQGIKELTGTFSKHINEEIVSSNLYNSFAVTLPKKTIQYILNPRVEIHRLLLFQIL